MLGLVSRWVGIGVGRSSKGVFRCFKDFFEWGNIVCMYKI